MFQIPYDNFQADTVAQPDELDANFAAIETVIGANTFTEQNYVTDDASNTANLDSLDRQLKTYSTLVLKPRPVTSWSPFTSDAVTPVSTRLGPFLASTFAYANRLRLGFQEPVLAAGLAHRLMLDVAMSTTSAANITLNMAYKVVPMDGTVACNLTTDIWRASWTPGASKKIVALDTAGDWREYTAGATGTTGATAPTFPTSGTVADNTVTWTAGSVIYSNRQAVFAVTAAANKPFLVDVTGLQIPVAEITAEDQRIVGFLVREVGSGHAGDMYLLDGHFKAVEV